MYTLMRLVQKIADACDSDEVDDWDETIESIKIQGILEDTYNEVIDRRDWEFIKDRLLPLEVAMEGDAINTLRIPEHVSRIQTLKFKDSDGHPRTVNYMEPADFVEWVMSRNIDLSNVTAIPNSDGIDLYIGTDARPQYWTSFDEQRVTFDSYDSAKGNGNQVADSVIMAHVLPVVDFTVGTGTLPLPKRMETLVLNEAIATANYRLRQIRDPRSERIANRQHKQQKQLEAKTKNNRQVKRYGRRTRSGR